MTSSWRVKVLISVDSMAALGALGKGALQLAGAVVDTESFLERSALEDGPFATAEIDALDLRGRSAVLLAAQLEEGCCVKLSIDDDVGAARAVGGSRTALAVGAHLFLLEVLQQAKLSRTLKLRQARPATHR